MNPSLKKTLTILKIVYRIFRSGGIKRIFAFLKTRVVFSVKSLKIFAILWTTFHRILILYLHCAILDKNGITKYLESVSYMLRENDSLLSLY